MTETLWTLICRSSLIFQKIYFLIFQDDKVSNSLRVLFFFGYLKKDADLVIGYYSPTSWTATFNYFLDF